MAEEIGARLMTEGERQFINAMESCQRAIDDYAKSVDRAAQASAKSSSGFDTFKQSATELKAKFDLVRQAAGMIEGALDKTIGATLRYSDQVRDLSRASGASAEESSRFIQVADDLQVSFDALKMAAKSSADQGIVLTVDAMAKLQEQYQAIKDPAERADFAIKAFGRSGLEMQKILEMDTEAFRNMAAGIDDSLIMTDDQVKSARELEIALDDMGDSVQGVVYQFSKGLIPILTAASGAVDNLTEMASGYSNILKQHSREVANTSKSYDEYVREMVRAKLVAGGYQGTQQQVNEAIAGAGPRLEEYFQKQGLFTKAQWEAINASNLMKQALLDTKDAAQITAAGFDEFSSSMGPSLADIKDWVKVVKGDATLAAKSLKDQMDELSTNIAGPVGKAVGDYNEKQKALNLTISTSAQRIQELSKLKVLSPDQEVNLSKYWKALEKSKDATFDFANVSKKEMPDALERMNTALSKIIDSPTSFKSAGEAVKFFQDKVNLLSSGTYLTEEQQKELAALKANLNEAELASAALKLEFEDASKRMIFSMLQTKLASDGLTEDEVANLIRIAEHWGLVDQSTATTAAQINALDLSNGRAELQSIDDVLNSINGKPRQYKFEIETIHTDKYFVERGGTSTQENPSPEKQRHGGEKLAGGGSFRMPDWVGYEGWQVGPGITASGGERVIVLPKNMSAGPVTNNYSTANNYNLNVMTSQSPAVVQRSFAMMKMLSEG